MRHKVEANASPLYSIREQAYAPTRAVSVSDLRHVGRH